MPARGFLWCFTELVFGRCLRFVGAIHESPVDFDVILPLRHALCACHLPNKWGGLRNGQDRSLRARNAFYRVGRGLELLACRLRQRFCSFHSQRCPPDTRAPRRQETSNPTAGASPRPTDNNSTLHNIYIF